MGHFSNKISNLGLEARTYENPLFYSISVLVIPSFFRLRTEKVMIFLHWKEALSGKNAAGINFFNPFIK